LAERGLIPSGSATFVVVPLPPSVWAMYSPRADGGKTLSPKYRSWLAEAEPILRGLSKPSRFPVKVHFVVLEWLHGSADVDNLIKPIRDGLVHSGVIPDDKSRYIRGGSDDYQPVEGGFGMKVWLEEVDPVSEKPKRKRVRNGRRVRKETEGPS